MLSHLITPNFQNISGPQIQMSVLQVQSREDAVCICIVSLTGLIILKDASPLALFQEKSPFEGIFFVLGDCPLHQVIWFLISSTRHQLSLERLGAVVSTLRSFSVVINVDGAPQSIASIARALFLSQKEIGGALLKRKGGCGRRNSMLIPCSYKGIKNEVSSRP